MRAGRQLAIRLPCIVLKLAQKRPVDTASMFGIKVILTSLVRKMPI